MKKQNIKNLIIVLLIVIFGICSYFYSRKSNQNYTEIGTVSSPQIDSKLQDTWVDGNYKYQVEKRMGEFYFVSITNNTPSCLDISKVEDPVSCAGSGYYAKDGETWKQSLAESLDCPKIVALGWPKNFDGNIESCYQ